MKISVRLLSLLLCFLMLFGATACNSKKNNTSSSSKVSGSTSDASNTASSSGDSAVSSESSNQSKNTSKTILNTSSSKTTSTTNNKKTNIRVSYFLAGFGSEWIKNIAAEYEKLHPDVHIVLEGNFDMANLINTRFEADDPSVLSDIYHLTNEVYYSKYIKKGYLEDLTSLYSENIEGSNLKNLVDPLLTDMVKKSGVYYAVPMAGATTGFVYNVGMFKKYGWKVPETMDQFVNLCHDIDSKGIVPVVYCGAIAEGYFSNIATELFGQYEGVDSLQEYFQYANPEVFKKEGRLKAYEQVARILCDPKITQNASKSYDHLAAQREFIKGNAAIIPNGSWLASEMSEFLKGYPNFEFAMMPTPFIKNDKTDKNGNPAMRMNASSSDILVIPKQSKNKAIAKDFLKFMCTQKMLNLYVESTGGNPRPLKMTKADWSSLGAWGQSIMSIWQSSYNIPQYSTAPIVAAGLIGNYMASGGRPFSYIAGATNVTDGMSRAKVVFNDDYAVAKQRFAQFK